jgi:hypothetical protein
MNHDFLLKKMHELRESWVQLKDERLKLKIRRPTKLEVSVNGSNLFGDSAEKVHKYIVDWSGFTERDIIGQAGGDDALDYHPDFVREYLNEHVHDMFTVIEAISESIKSSNAQEVELEKK